MENQEIYYIEESQAWVCPIAGRWKVIAVGGGASGGGRGEGYLVRTISGGTTSFGALISADGGVSTSDAVGDDQSSISGYGGFTGFAYGGIALFDGTLVINGDNATVPPKYDPTVVPTAALGWGAGGGSISTKDKSQPIAGRAGSIKTTIVTIDEGESIPCTIGKGGTATNSTNISAANGADGVIILQYLGE